MPLPVLRNRSHTKSYQGRVQQHSADMHRNIPDPRELVIRITCLSYVLRNCTPPEKASCEIQASGGVHVSTESCLSTLDIVYHLATIHAYPTPAHNIYDRYSAVHRERTSRRFAGCSGIGKAKDATWGVGMISGWTRRRGMPQVSVQGAWTAR